MHTEHLTNVRLVWVLGGWLVAVAVTSLVVLVLAGLDAPGSQESAGGLWAVVAVTLGFFAGGFFTGFKSIEAPILHGVGIGLTSLAAWFVLNLVLTAALPELAWEGLTPTVAAAIMLVQVAAAVAGGWAGHRVAIRGGPEPEEDVAA